MKVLIVYIFIAALNFTFGYYVGREREQKNCQQMVSDTYPPPAPTIILSSSTPPPIDWLTQTTGEKK